jgi:N-dimethylarginine dimethylaminohydrolase
MVGSEWAVYDVPIKEDNLTRAQYEQYQNAVLQDPGQAQILYHLDLGMSEPLQNGEILICPDITTPEKYQQIRDILGATRIIEVTREEALNMSTNLVQHVSNIIMSKASNRLRGILQEKGYHVFDAKDFGLKNFVIMDSGPHCLTNELTPSLG